MTADRTIRRRVSSGELAGSVADGVARFLGVPYAAAPFGDRRFAAPEPPAAWQGTRDATLPGATAPQRPYPAPLDRLLPTVTVAGDDILSVNIWAPEPSDPDGHPVLVWFHGGALTRGSNAIGVYDGGALARRGIVVVAANYRLGAEGFSVLDGAPLNLGLADQLEALRWVNREVATFGGDPRRVTAAGQSAGATTVAALVASPRARGLLHRAILVSGPLSASSAHTAGAVTRRMAAALRIPTTRTAFATVAPTDLLSCQEQSLRPGVSSPGAGFGLAVDGDLVPAPVGDALRLGAGADIPLLAGVTTEELRLWFAPGGRDARIRWVHVRLFALKARVRGGVVRRYRRRRPGARAADVLGALLTDIVLRAPLMAVADERARRGGMTWLYEFAWRSPVEDLGAAHGVDLPFAFDTLHDPHSVALTGPGAPHELARELCDAWAAFVHGQNPGWAQWDGLGSVRVFGDPSRPPMRRVSDDERAELRSLPSPRE